MKKVNIFIAFILMIMPFLFPLSIKAQLKADRAATSVIVKPKARFYGISPNGMYTIGNIGGNDGQVYSVKLDMLVTLNKPQAQANAVTNDGIVYGQYLNRAAYFEIDWETGEPIPYFLPDPEITDEMGNMEGIQISDVTDDGSLACGYFTNKAYEAWAFIWDLNAETVEMMEAPTTKDGVKIYGYMAEYMSADGSIIVGKVILDGKGPYQRWTTGIWNRDGQFIGYVVEDALELSLTDLQDEEVVEGVTANGAYIFGGKTTMVPDPSTGGTQPKYNPYIYEVKTGEFKIVEEIGGPVAGFLSASNDGVFYGTTNNGGIVANGTAMVYKNGKAFELADYLREFYQYDLDLAITGLPMDCTADGNTIVGTGHANTEDGQNICGYIINLGDIKTCPKAENLMAEVLGNETVTINWDKPQQYEAELAGYNVYRNDILVTSSPITDLFFSESLTEVGNYCYTVTVAYSDGCSSGKADPVCINIYPKGNCYTPNELTGYALESEDKAIKLLWEYPDFDLRYDSGVPAIALSNEGLPIYFGQKITIEDITENQWDGFNITDIAFFVNAEADYQARVYVSKTPHNPGKADNAMELVYKQKLGDKSDFLAGGEYYDKFSKFILDEPISISKEYNYYIVIGATNYDVENVLPAPFDGRSTKYLWKSDLIAVGTGTDEDETLSFISATANIIGFQGNCVLASTISPVREQVTSIPEVPSLFDKTLESYTIFRDGEELATVMTNQYNDNDFGTDNIEKSYTYKVVANYKYACTSEPTNDITVSRTSVDQYLTSMVNIYPNPVTGGVCHINGDYTAVSISDIQGRTVYQSESKNENSINVKGLKSGIYFVKIFVNEKYTVKKLIIK